VCKKGGKRNRKYENAEKSVLALNSRLLIKAGTAE